ncbi:(Fe-S)-binding protein [Campylobacter canadensis]|uniref:(Fe-S)-binding protein n=1 Tax=Campylobacter canadensis TaxID=449520 RepID=A0ABS7WST1_9BACT|nr:(Fe-S)-binding protein [Campylobacter canadensis]MBZ7987109.1 (Fe-S)-binding protein [Campylobacter canadensis]MBZ7994723.1 (Fe-S)-binding protein [Campylobacter canadensis]MBZ7996219.1 (Fe-S)-binding protein [Campylobacter canadensis]MBZ7998145.1 (Fe-S)-binding protein [Campylobacter canadensis]MBZ7999965.1 (Fe-S)-binding protein [Campylobacter canadensis]
MQKKVYFYATCLGTAAMQKMVLNSIKLLRAADVEVVFKKDQTCCGQPSYNTGYFNDTKKIALYNAEVFQGDLPIVIPSGSCGGMMSHDYLELFKDDVNYEKIKQFSSRVIELSQYLDAIGFKPVDKGEKIKVTWHSNCHALRVQKSIESNKKLLTSLSNVEVVYLEHEEECCGFGGTFSVKEPEISNAMAKAKVEDIIKSGASAVISADGGCLLNIAGTLSKLGYKDVKAYHLYDFLSARINGEKL